MLYNATPALQAGARARGPLQVPVLRLVHEGARHHPGAEQGPARADRRARSRACGARSTRAAPSSPSPRARARRDGRVGPFRKGIFYLARDLGVPIVPVAVTGIVRRDAPRQPGAAARATRSPSTARSPVDDGGAATDEEIPDAGRRVRGRDGARVDAYWDGAGARADDDAGPPSEIDGRTRRAAKHSASAGAARCSTRRFACSATRATTRPASATSSRRPASRAARSTSTSTARTRSSTSCSTACSSASATTSSASTSARGAAGARPAPGRACGRILGAFREDPALAKFVLREAVGIDAGDRPEARELLRPPARLAEPVARRTASASASSARSTPSTSRGASSAR